MAQGICARCQRWGELETHHIFQGNPLRKKATKYKLTVTLCRGCHQFASDSAHRSREFRENLRKFAEAKLMIEQGWSKEDFIREFGKNYLSDQEIAELYDVPTDGHFELIREEVELPW